MECCMHPETARVLINGGAAINMQDNDGRTALMVACQCPGAIVTVSALIEARANLNMQDHQGNTALILAASKMDGQRGVAGNFDGVSALISAHADLSIRGPSNRTAAEWAQRTGCEAVARLLLDRQAELQRRLQDPYGPPSEVTELVSQGADLNAFGWSDCSHTAIAVAASLGCLERVQALVEARADIERPPNRAGKRPPETALIMATKLGQSTVMAFLVRARANLDAENASGQTALMIAAMLGQSEPVRILCRSGASIAKGDRAQVMLVLRSVDSLLLLLQHLPGGQASADKDLRIGLSKGLASMAVGGNADQLRKLMAHADDEQLAYALQAAVQRGNVDMVGTLIREADFKHVCDGQTALMTGTLNGHTQVVSALLEANADVNARNEPGDSTAAMHTSSDGILELLLEAKAEVDLQNEEMDTALTIHAREGRTQCVLRLLSVKADLNIAGANGRTALGWARKEGHAETVAVLTAASVKAAGAAAQEPPAGPTPQCCSVM
mmetsp:Transcript_26692/g.52221  ORF Transcript_26692/g.52221 Transcript_26692/m.52221 type:complete len:501 (+) Transcript_26692:223-1725(+)